ncbi:hypothetical protein BWZ22_12685 [Seonamhaeicola sp. S2-3]|uniref:hypothetical protein n=1 Tax=Seonamhaeicola sp. S2-3 TaxID=1936081 RepID=UPI0009729ED4|nr:hypothetical protein [Seonamhaeicola sp. S2-3]APY12031.1 hypothetical protein BWZ22_12685 [Seonamhaeicola sp. S2-3]
MKKITGILGVIMIVAVAFLNVSSILQTDRDINLASLNIIQSANAEGVYGPGNKIKVGFPAYTTERIVYYNTGTPEAYSCVKTCHYSASTACWPGGSSACSPTSPIVTCIEIC